MNTIKTLFILLSLSGFIFQGCSSDSSSIKTYPTAIGESASIVTAEPNATMAPSEQALKIVSNEIGTILKTHISTLNEKEATMFTKEVNYCDISGEQLLENSGDFSEIISQSSYTVCKNEKNSQHGKIQISYKLTNNDGKFPQAIEIVVHEDYTFNELTLNQNTTLNTSNISYKSDGSIARIDFIVNGTVQYNYQTFSFSNLTKTITF